MKKTSYKRQYVVIFVLILFAGIGLQIISSLDADAKHEAELIEETEDSVEMDVPCTTDADCDEGLVCTWTGACENEANFIEELEDLLETNVLCTTDADCNAGFICDASTGACENEAELMEEI